MDASLTQMSPGDHLAPRSLPWASNYTNSSKFPALSHNVGGFLGVGKHALPSQGHFSLGDFPVSNTISILEWNSATFSVFQRKKLFISSILNRGTSMKLGGHAIVHRKNCRHQPSVSLPLLPLWGFLPCLPNAMLGGSKFPFFHYAKELN